MAKQTRHIEKIIQSFALKAYRGRPISDRFLSLLTDLYQSNLANGLKSTRCHKRTPWWFLVFAKIYLFVRRLKHGAKKASELELALAQLSFLWSSPPDQELYDLAISGRLSDKQVLRSQLIRLMEDKRFGALGEGFMNKWLEIERLNLIEVESGHKGRLQYNASEMEQLLRQEPLHSSGSWPWIILALRI